MKIIKQGLIGWFHSRNLDFRSVLSHANLNLDKPEYSEQRRIKS
jgi:hypothetical protein